MGRRLMLVLQEDLREALQAFQLVPMLYTIRSLPTGVSSTLVLGFLFTNRFSISTRPPSSNFARWLDRLPLINPVTRWRKGESAAFTDDDTVMIVSRRALTLARSSAIRLPRSPP